MRRTFPPLSFELVFAAAGCGPRQALTTWGYSDWYMREGSGEMGNFEAAQKSCLEQAGVAADPGSAKPNSPEKDAFIECMNGAHWCTTAFHCEKPGA